MLGQIVDTAHAFFLLDSDPHDNLKSTRRRFCIKDLGPLQHLSFRRWRSRRDSSTFCPHGSSFVLLRSIRRSYRHRAPRDPRPNRLRSVPACYQWNGCECVYVGGDCSPGSPIIVDTAHEAFHLTSAETGVVFDIRGDGHTVHIAWTGQASRNAFL